MLSKTQMVPQILFGNEKATNPQAIVASFDTFLPLQKEQNGMLRSNSLPSQ
jgi:hypothetical protein